MAPNDTSAGKSRVDLRILATSDLHAHLFPFDYYQDQRDDRYGLIRVAGRITRARDAVQNCLLLDNGDTLQGAPLGDAALSEMLPQGRPHPMIAAMNALGYDAATLGNHDFDYGMPVLRRALEDAAYPVVLANVFEHDTLILPPYQMLERHVVDADGGAHILRIAIVGVAPPQIMRWNRSVLGPHLRVTDMVQAARTTARTARRAGADLVIVLAHSGLGATAEVEPGAENVARAIAALPGIDAVVAGHTHSVYPPDPRDHGPNTPAPVVQPGSWGSHLGCIDLTLAPASAAGDKPWTVTAARAVSLAADAGTGAPPPNFRQVLRRYPELRETAKADHRSTRRFASRPLGQTRVGLETYFSFVAPCAATQLISDAQLQAARIALSDWPEASGLPVLSAVAPFRAGGRGGADYFTDVPAGRLRLRDAASLYAYPNQLAILKANGRQIRLWLERSASIFRQIDPEGPPDQALIDPLFAGYNFDRLVGVTYCIDPTLPPLTNAEGDKINETPGRVTDLRFASGAAVQDSDQMIVVTNAYRAEGGGHFPMAREAETHMVGPDTVRDLLAAYIAQAEVPIDPKVDATWRFADLGGVRVRFDTGPGAQAHRDRADALGLEPVGLQDSGFFAYSLTL